MNIHTQINALATALCMIFPRTKTHYPSARNYGLPLNHEYSQNGYIVRIDNMLAKMEVIGHFTLIL